MTIMLWSVFWPCAVVHIPRSLPALIMVVGAVCAYLCGHLAQAMSNIVEKWSPASRRFDEQFSFSSDFEKLVRDSVGKHFGATAKTLSVRELYLLCDQSLVHSRSLAERDIFIYREGFYRGNSVALAFVSLSLCVRLFHAPATIAFANHVAEILRPQVGVLAGLSAFGAWLAYKRYLRFRGHKYCTCFARFLSLWVPNPPVEHMENGEA